MLIISLKPNHDGAAAIVRDGQLEISLESEKDSHPRHSHLKPFDFAAILQHLPEVPDMVAFSGWHLDAISRHFPESRDAALAYNGVEAVFMRDYRVLGKRMTLFSSTHERSHILCSYGLSPFIQGQPCYVLTWEGTIGRFYEIDDNLKVTLLGEPLQAPGLRYSYLYYLGNRDEADFRHPRNASGPGKLMALSAYGDANRVDSEGVALIRFLLSAEGLRAIMNPGIVKANFPYRSPFLNIGFESQSFRDVARRFSDEIFDLFYQFAARHLHKRLPLLIGGGCGLNCEWNSRWQQSGLFPDVFVPPCVNDTGSAIGCAIDAQFHRTGEAKLRWTAYAGEPMVDDQPQWDGFHNELQDNERIAQWLAAGWIVAWVHGRYEIGPRALGNRSLLASPFSDDTAKRLNLIKEREDFRPIAPVCLEEDLSDHFLGPRRSPFMLHFHKVRHDRVPAVTHVDGSARVQTVGPTDNPALRALLLAFKRRTGVGVLCNTSLNFKGKGFINRTSDLLTYVVERDIDAAVVNGRMYHPSK